MKPRLLPDVRFLPSESGLSVRSPGHEASLHAPGLYPWFERVCPFLDGEHSVVDLVEKLSPMAAQRVLGLVEFLLREGFARDAQYDVPHTLSPSTRSLHAAVIEFLAHEADSPERRFQSYRECAPVAVGSGRLLTATALALLATGVEHVRVHVVAANELGETATDRDSLLECAKPLLHRDMAARLEFAGGEPRDLPQDAGVLLYASDRPDRARATRLRDLAARRGVRHGEAVVSADEVVISQVAVPTGSATRAPRPAGTSSSSSRPTSRYFGGPTAALAANQLCLSLLQHAAGLTALADEPRRDAVVLDLRTTNFVAV
ncbi:MAG TPA: hypothetical protein VFN97_03490 [Actinospica sp.]|nr:hypothetical protein [Actinospica sp.]